MRSRLMAATLAAALTLPLVVSAVNRQAQAGPSFDNNKWALIIGISQYKSPTHPTAGGAGDATTMYDVLRHHGWADDHIWLLEDGIATQDKIREGFQWLISHT